jgi:hypothetical protein
VQKILDWPTPRSVKDARGFIGICVYYRIFIVGFSVIAAPIMELFRKTAVFVWTVARQEAMDALKKLLTEAPTLITLDYSAGACHGCVELDCERGYQAGEIKLGSSE